jgi:hypothetical protein
MLMHVQEEPLLMKFRLSQRMLVDIFYYDIQASCFSFYFLLCNVFSNIQSISRLKYRFNDARTNKKRDQFSFIDEYYWQKPLLLRLNRQMMIIDKMNVENQRDENHTLIKIKETH